MFNHRPIDAHYNHDTGMVRLYYSEANWIDADVRGAITWPTLTDAPVNGVLVQDIAGFALIGALNPTTGKLSIVEQERFNSIQTVFNENGSIHTRGLARWFLDVAWARYYCSDFYWAGQADDLSKKYRVEAAQGPVIHPALQFPRLHVADESNAAWQWVKLGKLVIPNKTPLQADLMIAKADPAKAKKLIAYHALRCLLTSYDLYPYAK